MYEWHRYVSVHPCGGTGVRAANLEVWSGCERSIERLLSASVTCRLRKQSLYTYLTHVLTANSRGDPIPGLT